MAWRTTKNTVDLLTIEACPLPNFVARKLSRGCRYYFCAWEVVFVNSAMNSVKLDCSPNVKPRLVKAEAKPASSCKKTLPHSVAAKTLTSPPASSFESLEMLKGPYILGVASLYLRNP
ncbi:hypothetical protein NBRC116597_05750 [Phaeobacter sp. NW0010-22]